MSFWLLLLACSAHCWEVALMARTSLLFIRYFNAQLIGDVLPQYAEETWNELQKIEKTFCLNLQEPLDFENAFSFPPEYFRQKYHLNDVFGLLLNAKSHFDFLNSFYRGQKEVDICLEELEKSKTGLKGTLSLI